MQDSLAVSANSRDWFLLNASPDVARQIEATSALWPRAERGSPVRGVVLSNGDLDHVLGLLLLRENQPLSVYATPEVRAGLEQNAMLRTLLRFDGQLVWRTLELEQPVELLAPDGAKSGLFLRAFAAPGKPPLHLVQSVVPSAGDNVGLRIADGTGSAAVYAAATADVAAIASELEDCALLLLDGTFWSENELIDAGLGRASARDMAHLPVGGSAGSLAQCRGLRAGRKLFTHINNTNPLLEPSSDERRLIREQGWDLAEDGMHLTL